MGHVSGEMKQETQEDVIRLCKNVPPAWLVLLPCSETAMQCRSIKHGRKMHLEDYPAGNSCKAEHNAWQGTHNLGAFRVYACYQRL